MLAIADHAALGKQKSTCSRVRGLGHRSLRSTGSNTIPSPVDCFDNLVHLEKNGLDLPVQTRHSKTQVTSKYGIMAGTES